jgi:amino acid synthesis protein
MRTKNFGEFHVRKWYLQIEDTLANESGAGGWRTRPEDRDLRRSSQRVLGPIRRGLAWRGSTNSCPRSRVRQSAQGCHRQRDPVRDTIGGAKAWIPSTGKWGSPGTAIDTSLAHRDELYIRSHDHTVSAIFTDAPNADEVVIAFATSGQAPWRGPSYATKGHSGLGNGTQQLHGAWE